MNKEFGAIILSPSCDNNCLFCGDIKTASENEIKEQEIKAFKNLEEFKKKGIKQIEISGCDPIEYENIAELIEYIKKDFDFVQLSAHGRNLSNKEFAKKLVDSGVDKLRIPIYGSNAETHDAVTRVKGSFNETLQGIKNIIELSPKLEMQLSTLIMQENKNDMINIINLIKSLGITDFYVTIPCISTIQESSYIPLKDIGPYVKEILDYSKKNKFPITIMEVPFCIFGFFDELIINTNLPPDLGENNQPPEEYRTNIKDMPSYRIKEKPEICNKCACTQFCGGFFKKDLDKYGVGALKPISLVEYISSLKANL